MFDIDWQYLKDVGKGVVLLTILLLLILPCIAFSLVILTLLSPIILVSAIANWVDRH